MNLGKPKPDRLLEISNELFDLREQFDFFCRRMYKKWEDDRLLLSQVKKISRDLQTIASAMERRQKRND